MGEENYRSLKISYIVFTAIAALGAAFGALYFVNIYSGSGEIKSYLDQFTAALSGASRTGIMLRQIKLSAVFTAICVICSFGKIGVIPIAAITARRGFIYGFSDAALIAAYGRTGVLLVLSRLPEFVFILAAVTVCSSVCGAVATGRIERNKKFIICYLLFIAIIYAIFCIGAVCEGFISTTFMKLLASRAA